MTGYLTDYDESVAFLRSLGGPTFQEIADQIEELIGKVYEAQPPAVRETAWDDPVFLAGAARQYADRRLLSPHSPLRSSSAARDDEA